MPLGRVPFTVCCSLLLVGVGVGSGRAQAIHDGKITGTVVSEDGVTLPGATLEISSPALLAGTQATTTSARGAYVFLNLPPGKYRITASRDGFKKVTHDNLGVAAGAVVTFDLTLPVGTVQETIVVTAEGSIVDAKTSSIDSRIDQDMLAKLPTNRDAFYDLALTAPGMFDSASSNSLPSPTAYGSATNENVFLVNGVNTTDPEAGSFGSLVNVNYDAVEEVRVVALGSKAEYGSYSGAAVDVVTKSGSNEFHGSGAFYSLLGSPANNQPAVGANLGAPWLFIGPGEQLAGDTKQDWEASGTLGGPIVKDKLWFFGAFDYLRGVNLPPRSSLETQSWRHYADAKLSAAPFKSHRAWVAYHYENNDTNGLSQGPEPGWEKAASYGIGTVNHTLSAQWQWFPSSTTTASTKFLGFWKNDKPYLPSSAPANPAYINWWKWTDEVWAINGAFPYVDAQKANRQTLQADVSHYADRFLGQHDIKFGVQYTRGRGNRQEGYLQNYANFLYPYRWSQDVSYLQNTYGDTGLLFYNYRDTINPTLTVRTADSLGLFVDDQWTPTRRLTVNLGLRFDKMTTRYGAGQVYNFVNSPGEINGPPPVIRDRLPSRDVFAFNTLAPRIGLSYMLTPDGKTVARASYGRYYMPLSVEFLRRFGPDMPPLTRVTQMYEVGPFSTVDTNGDGFIDPTEARAAAQRVRGLSPISETTRSLDPSWTLNVGNNVKDQHTDQLTFNVEREIAHNFSVSASYIFKHTTDIFANIPINRVTGEEWEYERVPFTTSTGRQVSLYSIVQRDYNGDGVVDGADIQWINDNNGSRVQNMPAYDGVTPKRDYHGVQLVFTKKYSDRWQALASVLYSASSGIGRRTIRQDINVQGPEFWDDMWLGSLNDTINNLEGQLPFTPKYELKLSGSYKIPRLELDLGARFRLHTGRAMWRLEGYPQHTQFADPPGGVIDPGGLGRIVNVDPNNPSYLPTQTLLDLHVEKAIGLGDKKAIHLVADGFNVFNVSTPTDINLQYEWGKVSAIPSARRFRGGIRLEF